MKKLAITLSIFPGVLFVIALVSYLGSSFAEMGQASGGVDIGLCLLILSAIINIPTVVVWEFYVASRRDEAAER